MMKVMPIQPWECDEWFKKKHYARRMPNIMHSFGLYDGGILCGVISYGTPASPHLCRGICGEKYAKIVLELNRLVVDHKNKNAASFLIASSLKKLPRPMIIVSYADTKMGHVGYVYQATNWIYTGLSAKRMDPKHLTENNAHSRGKWSSEWEKVERSRKHRYLYFIGSKKEKKDMINSLLYSIEPYPKGDTKKYDASYSPKIQITMFAGFEAALGEKENGS